MEAQLKKIHGLLPGILVKGVAEYEAREELGNAIAGVMRGGDGVAAHDACKALQKELNCIVAPEVVLGRVAAPAASLRATIPSLDNRAMTLPLPYREAAALYRQLDPSLVGVELRGDVLDSDLRLSHEVLASCVELPACLREFAFPAEVRRMHERLCPSAESIRVEPYKLIVYGPGDFFVPHRDSMDEENMFGTISLGIPILPGTDGDDEGRANSDNDESRSGGRLGEPGHLVLYVGQSASDASVRSSYVEQEVVRENMLTYVVDLSDASTMPAAEGGEAGAVDDSVAMAYGAWTGDVLHEVRRLESGYRAVLTYKLYKEGHRESYIPAELRTSVERQVSDIVTRLAALTLPEDARRNGQLPEHFYLGFSLRHSYPLAGLKPHCLKGVDAIVYSVVSQLYETVLFTGYDVRAQEMTEMHALSKDLYARTVHVTHDVPKEHFGDEEAREHMAASYPVVANTVWVSLGYGALLGGGFCYGNWDCGTDWWYRQAYLLVSPTRRGA